MPSQNTQTREGVILMACLCVRCTLPVVALRYNIWKTLEQTHIKKDDVTQSWAHTATRKDDAVQSYAHTATREFVVPILVYQDSWSRPFVGRDPTPLRVSKVFLLLNYDGGVCDNTSWDSSPMTVGKTGTNEKWGWAVVIAPSALGWKDHPAGPSKVQLRRTCQAV